MRRLLGIMLPLGAGLYAGYRYGCHSAESCVLERWQGLSRGRTRDMFDSEALSMGQKVEMEHTGTRYPRLAERIAMDHLVEDPRYYVKLAEMESKK